MSEKSYCTKCPLFVHGCNPNIIGKLGDFIKIFGKIPDILVLITGHFGLFKTPTLRLGEVCKTQTQSQTQRLNFAKTDFKSVRKTIFALGCNSNIIGKLGDFIKFYGKIPDILVLITGHFGLFKTPTLRLGEAGIIQTQSRTRRLRIAKIHFKSVRKTIPKNHNYKIV